MSLLTDASIRKYYEDASQNIEHRSSDFWFGILRRNFGQPFEITPGYSPNGSHESVGAVVEKFEGNQEHRIVLLWVQCKCPADTVKDVETQALEAALRCLDNQNLAHVWAITTIGVRFRLWRVWNDSRRLVPWHGIDTKYDELQYVDADTPEAMVFTQAVGKIDAERVLVDTPSHSSRQSGNTPAVEQSASDKSNQ